MSEMSEYERGWRKAQNKYMALVARDDPGELAEWSDYGEDPEIAAAIREDEEYERRELDS